MRIVVAAKPGDEITVAPELELVKAALLYGDRVVLISPTTTMLLGVEALEHFSPTQQIELIRQVAPYLMEANDLRGFQSGIEQIDELLKVTSGARSPASRLVRGKLQQALAPAKTQLVDVVSELSSRSALDQLAAARAAGLVEIDSMDPGNAVNLLAWCVIAAKLAERGRQQSSGYVSQMMETFMAKLSTHLSSGREYLIFDEAIAGLVDAAIREGLLKPAKGPAGRSAQAMAASALMDRLPTFPGATVDEVVDIRSELSVPLTQFRGAMASVAKDFTSEAWERGFEDEVQDAWVGTVHPALESIEAAVQDNRSLLAIASGVVGAGKASFPGLLLVGAGLMGHAGTLADIIGGTLSAGAPLLRALRNQHSAAAEIRMRPFYFLYGVEHALEGTSRGPDTTSSPSR